MRDRRVQIITAAHDAAPGLPARSATAGAATARSAVADLITPVASGVAAAPPVAVAVRTARRAIRVDHRDGVVVAIDVLVEARWVRCLTEDRVPGGKATQRGHVVPPDHVNEPARRIGRLTLDAEQAGRARDVVGLPTPV